MKKNANHSAKEPNIRKRHEGGAEKKPPAGIGLDKGPTKQQLITDLLLRDEGATLSDLIAATGWLPHTTRAALTGIKKKGYALSSDKVDGVRTYRAVAPV